MARKKNTSNLPDYAAIKGALLQRVRDEHFYLLNVIVSRVSILIFMSSFYAIVSQDSMGQNSVCD